MPSAHSYETKVQFSQPLHCAQSFAMATVKEVLPNVLSGSLTLLVVALGKAAGGG